MVGDPLFVATPICVVGIEGLANVLTDKYDLDLFNDDHLLIFVGEKRLRQSFVLGS